jgi:LuxR family maltose regulon positive regulatory protein
VTTFSGNERHVVDYLGTEVLGGLPGELRVFLMQTSVLERLCGSLCDAVVERAGSAALLESIERSNLFLVPLDTEREWYRYHHLFGELLRHELARAQPDASPTLHRRAMEWFRRQGHIGDAVHHAIAGGDEHEAASLIARHWNDFVNQGRVETVDGWLATLPIEVIRDDARLCLAGAGTSLTIGRRDDVDPWLDQAERGAATLVDRSRETSIESETAIYRAVHRYMAGDCTAAADAAQQAVALELGYLADIHAGLGDLDHARRIATSAIVMGDEHGLAEHWVPHRARRAPLSTG